MSRATWFACGVAAALALLVPAAARAADEPDLAGKYLCVGTNLNGNEYRGVANIKQVGDIYRITWRIGSEEHHGVGILQGDVLAVAWAVVSGGDDAGIVAYKIRKDGKLEGKWIGDYEKGEVLPETLTPFK